MIRRHVSRAAMIAVSTAFVFRICANAFGDSEEGKPMILEMVCDSIVDKSALNFTSGRFGTCINGQTYQQEALLSFNGFQYAGYFADGGVLCLARRQLPDATWQVIPSL